MRPIKLSLTAFGPFINTEVINFDAFGKSSLFLINGTTGSGKTTILDAICFALYGQTTGNEREAMQMRCDFASDDLLTEVEFIFELSGKHYKILRLPEQTRKKSKGNGTTKQVASAELSSYELNSSGDKVFEDLLVARKVSDANRAIEDITGLKVDQFRQVMVLPQGKFRKLLMADSKDREVIFSQLFETHIYKRIEDKLKSESNKVAKKVDELKENQRVVLQSVGLDNIFELEELIEKLRPEVKEIGIALALKEKQYLSALKDYERAVELEKSFITLEQQEIQLKVLQDQESDYELKKKQLESAETAERISSDFKNLSKVKLKKEVLDKQISELEEIFKRTVNDLRVTEVELSKNPQRVLNLDQLKEELVVLNNYESQIEKLTEAKKNNESTQFTFSNIQRELATVQQTLNECIQNKEQAYRDKRVLEASLVEGADFKVNLNILNEQLYKRKQYEETELSIKTTLDDLQIIIARGKQLKYDFEEKENASKKIEFRWYQAQAAVLAKELQHDLACPVCGSLDHPMPAKSKFLIPTSHEREDALKDLELSRRLVEKARENYLERNSELKSLYKQQEGLQNNWNNVVSVSLSDLQEEKIKLLDQIKEYETQQKDLEIVLEKISVLDRDEIQNREKLEKILKEKSDLDVKSQMCIELVKAAEEELPENLRDLLTLKELFAKANNKKESLEKSIKSAEENKVKANNEKIHAETNLENQTTMLKSLKVELALLTSNWQSVLLSSGFNNEEVYINSLCDNEIKQSLKLSIEEYNKALQKLMGALIHQKNILKNKVKPDVILLKSDLESVYEKKLVQDQLNKDKSVELSHYLKAKETLVKIQEEQAAKEKEYQIVGTLSDVANGATGNKISLQRFVLSVILDDVLIDASNRLKILSKGRYLLLRKEDRSKGNKASGLELEVEDSWTGKVRSVSTLSGGESFMASLSLALGLSSVVQAYAGGIHLNTLFVDEGFGSLDSGSLDKAIRVLMELRDTGRMIGVISHVSELKEQIPLRLDVKTSDHGSYIELVNS